MRPADYHAASRINAGLPWLKVALLTAQYFPPEGNTLAGPLGKSYGNLVAKGEWERLAKASAGSLMQTEAFLSYLVEHYMKPEGVPAEKLAVEIPAAFARTARAVLLARDLEKDPINLEKVWSVLDGRVRGFKLGDRRLRRPRPDQRCQHLRGRREPAHVWSVVDGRPGGDFGQSRQ